MLLLGGVRVHVAKGAVPSPEHSAAHVAPTLMLVQTAAQLALLIARVGTLVHSTAQQQEQRTQQAGVSYTSCTGCCACGFGCNLSATRWLPRNAEQLHARSSQKPDCNLNVTRWLSRNAEQLHARSSLKAAK